MFHLFTHAFFKGLLFLAAGSVITAMHHEQDMRAMGGLWKRMPVTYAVMLIGTLAITGVGIPGLELGFAGFYSKDADIDASYLAALHGSWDGYFAFVIGVIAAGLTSFYSWRLIFMTFHGTPKWAQAGGAHGRDAHAGDHASSAQADDEPLEHGHDAHGHFEPHESTLGDAGPAAGAGAGRGGRRLRLRRLVHRRRPRQVLEGRDLQPRPARISPSRRRCPSWWSGRR